MTIIVSFLSDYRQKAFSDIVNYFWQLFLPNLLPVREHALQKPIISL